MVDYAESLARTYLKRGETSRDWKDYLKAHGLANYCVAVDSTPERCRLVYDVEVSWYKGSHPISYVKHTILTNKHKQLLNEYRDGVKSNFLPLDALGLSLDAEDIYSDENMSNAQTFCDQLFELSRKSSDDFVSVTRNIIESSVELLKRIKMDPPCGFAVIGLGSVAKGEATPYSDVEYAFITERDDTKYFEMLAMDSYFRIGNLGETPLKCFNIEELKVEKGSPPIIADLKTVGFRIDGISRSAGNIPTGNGLDEGQSLTFTVDNLMKLYRTAATCPFTGLADKSDMLSSTVVIYTNEGDKSQLHNQFIEERMSYELNVAQNSVAVKESRMQSFLKDVNTFTFLPKFVKYQPPQNMNIKVKIDIFRYPTLLANNIKMFMGWNLRYPWEIYSKFRGKMSKETYSYMRIVLALSIYMRTRAYLHHRCQTEHVSLVAQQAGSVKELYQVPSSLFVILGCLLGPIKHAVKSNVESASLAADSTSLADAIDSVMQHIEFDKTNHIAKAEICYFAGEYELAKKELSKVIKGPIETTTSAGFLEIIQSMIEDSNSVTTYMALCCYILYHTEAYRAAADFFSWFIDKGEGEIGHWRCLSTHCRKESGDHRVTRQILNEATHAMDSVGKHIEFDKTNHIAKAEICYFAGEYELAKKELSKVIKAPIETTTPSRFLKIIQQTIEESNSVTKYMTLCCYILYHTKSYRVAADFFSWLINKGQGEIGLWKLLSAHCREETGDYRTTRQLLDEAKQHLEKAHGSYNNSSQQSLYTTNTNHQDISVNYSCIGNVYDTMGEYDEAIKYHKMALKMDIAMFGKIVHPDIATDYGCIGNAYTGLGGYTSALDCFIKTLEMMKAIYGADTNHPDIATSYNNIASIYNKLGDLTLSLEYHIKSLEMRKAIYGADTNHPDIAASYNNIANVYRKRGDLSLSLEYYIKSLEMMKAIHGTDTNHPDIAISYNNIASVYNMRGVLTLSLEYYIKSLEMKKAIYGADTNHPDIATSYNNIAGVYRKRGDLTLSLEYYIKSLEMNKAIYGTDTNHPYIAISYNNIAGVYDGRGTLTLSLEYHIKSLEMMKAIHGTDTNHPDIATSYNNIANVYRKRGDLTLSLEYYIKSLEMLKAIYGADSNHPHIKICRQNIADIDTQM